MEIPKECISRPITKPDDLDFTFIRCPHAIIAVERYNECDLMPDRNFNTWQEQYANCPIRKQKA